MISSVLPMVSSAIGLTGYISAVSTKLIPLARAQSSCACASASEVCVPKVMVPRHNSETMTPVRPIGFIFIVIFPSRFFVRYDFNKPINSRA